MVENPSSNTLEAPDPAIFFEAPWAVIRHHPPDHGLWAGDAYILKYRGPSRVQLAPEIIDEEQVKIAARGKQEAHGIVLQARAAYQATEVNAPLGSLEWYRHLRAWTLLKGYICDIPWSETLEPIADADEFWREYAFVVLNSGMKNTVATGIWRKVQPAVESGGSALTVFNHKLKAAAIDNLYRRRVQVLAEYQALAESDSEAKLAYLGALSWIGPITKYHLAKNFGLDVAKPDRHLERIAGRGFANVQAFCEKLARESGDRIATVDLVIWRAAAIGMIDTRSMLAS